MDNILDVQFGFGLNQDHCEGDRYGSVEGLLENAKFFWEKRDGNPFDSDDSGIIFVGVIEDFEPYDFAPSLDDIADDMTDSFYCEHNVDDDADVQINERKEAEALWKEFVNKYFEMPCTYTCAWFGRYSLVEDRWVDKFAGFISSLRNESI